MSFALSPHLRFNGLLLASAVALAMMAGCAYDGPSGKPLPQLDYQNIAPLTVSAGTIDVVNNFRPTPEKIKAASAFPTRPDDALTHYAQNRLKSNGTEGSLKFTIDDATVRHSVLQPDNSVMKWANVGRQDRYDVSIRVTLAHVEGDGRQSSDASLELNRYITVPQSYSIAKRETTLRDFMGKLIQDFDQMVTTSLQDRMRMAVSGSGDTVPKAMNGNQGPTVPSMPVTAVHPEALPPPW